MRSGPHEDVFRCRPTRVHTDVCDRPKGFHSTLDQIAPSFPVARELFQRALSFRVPVIEDLIGSCEVHMYDARTKCFPKGINLPQSPNRIDDQCLGIAFGSDRKHIVRDPPFMCLSVQSTARELQTFASLLFREPLL
jgi:hypothetical protein